MINNQHKNKERSQLGGGQKSAPPVQTAVQMSCLCMSDAVCSSGPRIPSWSLPDETWHLHLQRNTSRGVLFCLFKKKKKEKRKKDKGKEKQRMTVGNWQHKETLSSLSWLIYWTETSEARARVAIAAPTVALSLSLCISYLLTYIYIYIYIFFLHLQDIMIPIVPIWIQVWFLEHRNVFYSVVAAELGLLSQLHTNVPFRILLGCVCVFFLHKKYVCLVQWLLFYPDDWGYAGYPPQLPAEDVFTELGRVHSSPTGAHNFKSSLLQPLEDLWRQQDRHLLRGKASASAT